MKIVVIANWCFYSFVPTVEGGVRPRGPMTTNSNGMNAMAQATEFHNFVSTPFEFAFGSCLLPVPFTSLSCSQGNVVIIPIIVVQEFLADHFVTCVELDANVAFKKKIFLFDCECEKIVDD